jgi:hypothetical protein
MKLRGCGQDRFYLPPVGQAANRTTKGQRGKLRVLV